MGFLVAIVVGCGIAAQRLWPDDEGLQLFEGAAATAARVGNQPAAMHGLDSFDSR